jgi:hypothetical protein
MTIEQYLQQQIQLLADRIATKAPVDCCPACNIADAHLVYDGTTFLYECKTCDLRWSPECLEVDKAGNFQIFELAD